ncbi:hypothetical protein KP509_24G037000 [Ceratopteris richardii]|uniref:ER-bound oxygenase mpaB/mpaB'/Rubber oxygenase catalytic domain-containing protein n=1 Tax=Ceratopteris richardii TaxID=49495 RepID=A0A8T2RVM9_CERRI|nr:hypothetical protein KP509_24G037000 [Ceratopteris richardii]
MSLFLIFNVIIFIVVWKLACVILRRGRALRIARLHSLRHRYAILIHMSFVDFPFICKLSLEFGLFRTYSIPSISRILFKSGNFPANSSKRYDDTEILVKELFMHHVDGDRGSIALRRLNFIHSQFKINNADYLYVLSIFVLEPLEWISRYGYRESTEPEKLAMFSVWHDIGVRMGIHEIPSTIEELAAYKEAYEREHMIYSATNKEIAELTMNLLLSEVPTFLWPIARKMAYAFMDDRLRKAMGYPKQPEWLSSLSHTILRLHGYAVRWMPPRPLSRAVLRIPPGCPVQQGACFDPCEIRQLLYQAYKPHHYEDGYRVHAVGAMKPGCLGDPCPGDLLLPLSECENILWDRSL